MTSRVDEWTTEAARITDPETLAQLERVLEHESPVIVEHRFYRASRAPYRFVVEDFDELVEYLRTKTGPGDSFYMWHFDQCCRDDNGLARGKCPDADGKVPIGGVY